MSQREIIRKRIRLFFILGAILIILGYGALELRNVALGPNVEIIKPRNGEIFSESVATISGTTANIAFLTLNGRKIFADQDGNFREDIVLSPGYNVAVIVGKDKFGKSDTKKLELIYK